MSLDMEAQTYCRTQGLRKRIKEVNLGYIMRPCKRRCRKFRWQKRRRKPGGKGSGDKRKKANFFKPIGCTIPRANPKVNY
jgi:hypothetical protein